jgi:hypothetical protein
VTKSPFTTNLAIRRRPRALAQIGALGLIVVTSTVAFLDYAAARFVTAACIGLVGLAAFKAGLMAMAAAHQAERAHHTLEHDLRRQYTTLEAVVGAERESLGIHVRAESETLDAHVRAETARVAPVRRDGEKVLAELAALRQEVAYLRETIQVVQSSVARSPVK